MWNLIPPLILARIASNLAERASKETQYTVKIQTLTVIHKNKTCYCWSCLDAIVKSEEMRIWWPGVRWTLWQTLDWMWAGAETITTPRGPHRGQVISGVIASVISTIYTFIIIKCRQVNLLRVNDRRTTYLIWCAYLQLDICFMIYISICGRWMSIDYNEFTINWIDFAENENSDFARVLLRYQSCSIFYTLENLEC